MAERIGHRGLACRAAFTAAVAEPCPATPRAPYAALADTAPLGLLPLVADGLEIVAALAADEGRTLVAARLQGAAGRLRAELALAASPLVRLLTPPSGRAARRARSPGRPRRVRRAGEPHADRASRGARRAGLSSGAIGRAADHGRTVRTHLRASSASSLGVANRAELAARCGTWYAGRQMFAGPAVPTVAAMEHPNLTRFREAFAALVAGDIEPCLLSCATTS